MTEQLHDDNDVVEPILHENPDTTNSSDDEEKMTDKYYLTHVLFYALGTLTLVPQNFFITANDYWMYKFRDPDQIFNASNTNRTGLQAEFTSKFSIVSHVTSIIVLVITIVLAKRVAINIRLIGGLCMMLLMFLFTLLFVEIDTDSWQKGFFGITLISGSLLNGTGSVFMVTLFQLVSKFPPSYLAAQLSGQAICGIFAALIQIFTLAIGATSDINALIYFSIGAICVIATLIFYIYMLNCSELFHYYADKVEDASERPNITLDIIKTVMNKVKYLLLTMIVVMGCSVMIHPGLTSLVASVGSGHKWNDKFFVPVSTFLFYNSFDFIGRELAGKIKRPKSGIIMLIVGIIRIAFVPMLMLCNVKPRHHLPVVFNSDLVYMVFIIIFSFTNGYLVNLCIIQMPNVTEKEERAIAMFLVVIFMIISLGACSFLNILLINAV